MRLKQFMPVLVGAACYLLCCAPKGTPQSPTTTDACIAAEENLLKLECKDENRLLGGPNRHGVAFSKTCADFVTKGLMTLQQARCLATITDCKQVDPVCSWGE